MLQAQPQQDQPHLPDELLEAVFNALDHHKDLLARACVCKAWRPAAWKTGKAKALLPKLNLQRDHNNCLVRLNHFQREAVRELDIWFFGDLREYQ